MITIGCAGFAVPATRYFKEYLFVEIQETHLATPGQGTVRRWQREAPQGFQFALLAPREIGQEQFRDGDAIQAALARLNDTAKELNARTAVFLAPADFPNSRTNKSALKAFLTSVKKHFDRVVFDAGPGWKPDDADSLAEDTKTVATRDPLQHGLSKRKEAYYRLPGPAGHKSRYEDPVIDRLGEIASEDLNQNATYVFTNVDMFADAKRFRKTLGV
jgi:uncharacterized protein YecE (DUF72 family)